jgi:hypothetical protein
MKWLLGLVAVVLAGCVSTEMKTFVGKPVEETYFAYGKPENILELPDGRRAYQFRWGGGTVVVPERRTTEATVRSGTVLPSPGFPQSAKVTATTTTTPARIYESAGCLITFIARDSGRGFVIEEYRIPKQLVC